MSECIVGSCKNKAQPEHSPCCSSHQMSLCCHHYTSGHFVEVNQCSPETHGKGNVNATT